MHPDCLSIIGVKDGQGITVGAGFLLKTRDNTFVVTAAHVPSGNPGFADFSVWPPQISVVPNIDGSLGVIDLFVAGRPNFLFYRGPDGHMSDMMAVPIGRVNWPTRVFDLSDNAPPTKVQTLTGYGFPERAEAKRPYWPPDRIEGKFVRETDGSWRTSLPVKVGHSGGPVVCDGKLCGMIIGTDDNFGTVIPTAHLRLLFR